MKRMSALLLAMMLCLSMAACGGKPEETSAPAPTDPLIPIIGQIFSNSKMEGVEHIDLYINADTATEEQVQFAMAALNVMAHEEIEGYNYLRRCWMYTKMVFADGTYYMPFSVALPTAGDTDLIYMNGTSAVSAYQGSIGVASQATTFLLSEEKLAELKALDGWGDLAESQIYLLYLMSDYLDQMGLSIESEGVQYKCGEVSAFAQCAFETESGSTVTVMDLQIADRDTTGAYVCTAVIVTGIPADAVTAGREAFSGEKDYAVFQEVFSYYNLNSWYE